MIDGEARIKAGITCACSRCDTSTSSQRRVCRCILTSGRRAPSSHPARCSWCHRRTVQTVALKIARFPPFLDPLTRQESAAWPPPSLHLPEKCFYLELPPPPPLSPPPPPPRPLGNQWSHDMERLLVISSICFHSRGGKMCFKDPAVVTSPAASSQPLSRECAWTSNDPLRVRSQD